MTKQISRRELLKAVIAGSGGFVATSFIPEKWLKPVVKSGVLPVHAQASTPTPTATPTQNYVKGFAESDEIGAALNLRAYALVSSTPFTGDVAKQTGIFKLASPIRKPGDDFNPVEGEEVSLYVKHLAIIDGEEFFQDDFMFISTKTTDENGFVKWDPEEIIPEDQGKGYHFRLSFWFKFEIQGDSDEVEHVLIDVEFPDF